MGKLNDKAVAAKQPQEKQYAVADGDGLTLVIKPNGTKLWWLRYRFGGTAKTLSLGVYPVVSLKQAREWGLEARKLLAAGIDPGKIKMEAKLASSAVTAAPVLPIDTVEQIGREWFEKFGGEWVDSHGSKVMRRMERDLFPWLSNSVQYFPLISVQFFPLFRFSENDFCDA